MWKIGSECGSRLVQGIRNRNSQIHSIWFCTIDLLRFSSIILLTVITPTPQNAIQQLGKEAMKVLMADRTSSKAYASNGKTSKSVSNKSYYSNPAYQLPDEVEKDPNRYELWTVRLPIDMTLTDLDGTSVQLEGSKKSRFELKDKRYEACWGSQVENESCRLLVQPSKSTTENNNNKATRSDSDDSSEDETEQQKEGFLYPSSRSFSRHLIINEHFTAKGERTLAPAADQAPPSKDPLRLAYTHVPQRTNLHRRWHMPGARVETKRREDDPSAPIMPPPKRKLSEVDTVKPPPPLVQEQKPQAKRKLAETSIKEAQEDSTDRESDRKAAKRAKKEAKKAKKEAKKEAKEAKKAMKAEKKIKKEKV